MHSFTKFNRDFQGKKKSVGHCPVAGAHGVPERDTAESGASG